MRNYIMRPNKEMCKCFEPPINYLGHTIGSKGQHKNKDKVDGILYTKQPSKS